MHKLTNSYFFVGPAADKRSKGRQASIIRNAWSAMIAYTEPPTCPNCGQRMTQIVYGLPDEELANDSDVFIGGCIIEPSSPNFACSKCGHEV